MQLRILVICIACLSSVFAVECWHTASVGVDLAWGEWDGTGATSFMQCKEKAEAAGVQYFAWTPEVYSGYCKVLKPSVAVPNLSTNQGYGYKLWQKCFSRVAEPGRCLKTEEENIGMIIGNNPHTIQVQLTFPDRYPSRRQWILNLGQRTAGAQQWIWNSQNTISIGVDISKCSYLTTTYNGSVWKLYCNGVFMAQRNTKFSINSDELSIGYAVHGDGADFAGCISEVSIFAYEKSADEIEQFDCWQTASVGVDLAWGQWDGTGATSFEQCKANAESAGVPYFAWTAQVYGGYCKVLKPSVTVPNLSTNQGYGYKLWQNTCIEPNPTEEPTWSTQRCVLEECGCNLQGQSWCDDSNAWIASSWCHASTSNCAACHGEWCGTNRRLLQGY